MHDAKYCYPDSDVLVNKLGIKSQKQLFEAEKELTAIRLQELEEKPIKGKYDFAHLKAIHKYIFQDVYGWAGKERTVEIGKGIWFCPTIHIQEYAATLFGNYYPECYDSKDNREKFIKVLSKNYGDLNALHPFREGNGRTQREFARIVCLSCGYDFSLGIATHNEMLAASKQSFSSGDNSLFEQIFKRAITPLNGTSSQPRNVLSILTSDDLSIEVGSDYDYYSDTQSDLLSKYDSYYLSKIANMKNEQDD